MKLCSCHSLKTNAVDAVGDGEGVEAKEQNKREWNRHVKCF